MSALAYSQPEPTPAPRQRMPRAASKTATIHIRLTDEEDALLECAAKRTGTSKSALLREHGLAAARDAMAEERVMQWPAEAFDAMLERIENPDLRPNEDMQRSLRRHRVWDRD
jgi:uncharacterized protein (DUF1778 family)